MTRKIMAEQIENQKIFILNIQKKAARDKAMIQDQKELLKEYAASMILLEKKLKIMAIKTEAKPLKNDLIQLINPQIKPFQFNPKPYFRTCRLREQRKPRKTKKEKKFVRTPKRNYVLEYSRKRDRVNNGSETVEEYADRLRTAQNRVNEMFPTPTLKEYSFFSTQNV
jgi:hypothetical protein